MTLDPKFCVEGLRETCLGGRSAGRGSKPNIANTKQECWPHAFCAQRAGKTSVQRCRNLPSFFWLVSSPKILSWLLQNFVFWIHTKIFGVNLILFLCLILQMKRISVWLMNYFIGTRRKITTFEEFIAVKMILWSSGLWHHAPDINISEAYTISVFRVERGTNPLGFITCKPTIWI
jgi:hypothetical protein